MRARTDRPDGRQRPQARKRFGQNFLEPAWARKVVAAIDPHPDEAFLEIGPGPGAITRPLAASAGSLVAVELDRDLAAALRDEHLARTHVIEADFLKVGLETLRAALVSSAPDATGYRVAGNLPYNVASPIMFRLVELSRLGLPLADATLMLQREVADRLLAKPGTGDYGLLTVLVGHRASVDRVLNLPPGAFRPAPKVHSSVVRLRFHPPEPAVREEAVLAGVVSAVFSRRRKTLANALLAYSGQTPASANTALTSAGIDPIRRPETLSIAEFCRLSDFLHGAPSESRKPDLPPVL